jgi:hypothetical protein
MELLALVYLSFKYYTIIVRVLSILRTTIKEIEKNSVQILAVVDQTSKKNV